MKRCPDCGKVKPAAEYFKDRHAHDGRSGYCKSCHMGRAIRWRKKNRAKYAAHMRKCLYGITPEDFEKLTHRQSGRCAICGSVSKLSVDHCHSSNRVRGLLCRSCNFGLGHFQDRVDFLRSAIRYLESHE